MNLDSKTKGQLGMRDCQGMWDRLDRYKVNRRRSTTSRRKSVATSQTATCEPTKAPMRQWHAVCETATGQDRAFVRDAASKAEFDKLASHHCDRQGWVFLWSKPAALMGA